MKILHIDEQLGWRGGEQQASWLIQGLCARGHEVHIAARPAGKFLGAAHGGVSVSRLPVGLRSEFGLFSAWRIAQYARRNRIDVFHAHTSHAHTIALLARAFAGQGKVVVSRRVSFPPKHGPLNRWKYRTPDRIVCVSKHVAEVLAANGVPAQILATVHSSVDMERLDVPPLSRESLGIPEDRPLIVNAGALVGHKDHFNLLEAFAAIRPAFPTARLVIAGEGPLRGEIETRIRTLGLQDVVVLLGHRTDAPALIRAGDLYVSSSWSEGLGTSVLEALACGTPVVAAEAGGAAEMVISGETGYLVPCRDAVSLSQAITESLRDPEKSRTMAGNGQALIAREFTTERMVERTIEVYRELLQETENGAS